MTTEWLIAGNPKKYDVINAFKDLKKVDWKQTTNVQVGDIVYIYVSDTVKAVKFKCKVNKVDLKNLEIEDQQYNISGEFDGTYGRYMELELLKELKGNLYSLNAIKQHGLDAPQSPVRITPQGKEYLDLVQKLQKSEELDPDSHDGSYQLVRATIEEYAKMDDLSVIDYKDLNLVYLMTVGTWKQKVPAKKKTINESNLPEESKIKLCDLLDDVWSSAEKGYFSNQERGRTSIGMFGTGFFSFMGKTDEASPRNFIQMCIDIKDIADEDAIIDRCGKTLNSEYRGMKAASASMVLHCLKPTVFPIFNSNMGADNIFIYLGVEMKWKTEVYSYTKNTRLVKAMRDENFSIKNYRLFDMAAWGIGAAKKKTNIDYIGVMDYLENNKDLPYSNPEAEGISEAEKTKLLEIKSKGQNVIKEMKKMAELCKSQFGLDKCEPMSWLDGSNTKTRRYLWAQLKYSEYGTRPESISIFVEMSSDTNRARYRFSLEMKNDKADKDIMSNYHRHFDLPMQAESSLVYVGGSNEYSNPVVLNEDVETIKSKVEDGTYRKVQISRIVDWDDSLTNDEVEQDMLSGISELIPYYEHVLGIKREAKYWPSLDEYDPGLSKDKWLELLNNPVVTKLDNLRMLKMMIEQGGESTCSNLANHYGGSASSYNAWGTSFGERVHKYTECPLCADYEKERFYTVPFVGRDIEEDGHKRYSWKLRDELKEALEEMDLSKVNNKSWEGYSAIFDKNIILYGPPGTGKTYKTAVYAVAIIEEKTLESVNSEDYKDVLERYNKYKKEGLIAFTTFHQSYGYEEFIEGIKPVIADEDETGDVAYKIEEGVFKKFCSDAKKVKIDSLHTGVNSDSKIWKVTIKDGTLNDIKQECYDESYVRIGYGATHKYARAFVEDVKPGDIVISLKTRDTIDGIAVVTGELEILTGKKEYQVARKVEWLVKGIDADITSINEGKKLHRMTFAAVPSMQVEDIMKLAESFNAELEPVNIKENDKNYVFVIDEINRGNISKIFGELITLIEDTKRAGEPEAASAILPYSGESFSVPNNVYIIGTMNTADRSIALMDTALRRRFKFVEMMPDSNVLIEQGANKINEGGVELDVAKMLDTINTRIEYLYDREHTIGHAFFISLKNDPTVSKLAGIFKNSVLPLLQEYFYEDYSKIMLILGDNGKLNSEHRFIMENEIKANLIFRGDTSDIDLPEYSYDIQYEAFDDIMSYIGITE